MCPAIFHNAYACKKRETEIHLIRKINSGREPSHIHSLKALRHARFSHFLFSRLNQNRPKVVDVGERRPGAMQVSQRIEQRIAVVVLLLLRGVEADGFGAF